VQWIGLHDSAVQGTWQFTSGADATWFLATNPWAAGQPDHYAGHGNGLVEHQAHVTDWTAAMPINDYADGYRASWETPPVLLWGCCEAAALPLVNCPTGFHGPDAAGYCYNTLTVAAGYNWSDASTACRALGYGASLASIVDATTAVSVLTSSCYGTLASGYSYW
jgi:hypothetical protein